eukprot:TRINITY_DN7374_c0_g1_i1.p1 TRINITY_DN7374_c0_g1~~TRINITY_DN7374_c0_g1_i1.p1  ORF type:complete len:865 (-),score=208.62 TRINITY_DN7374_c0_g1_i1:464-2989(-)
MGKAKGKHRLDTYYRLAKEQGYRSRAAFKIAQLDAKFKFFHSARSLIDLCAAPGGWMQVAVKMMPVGSLIIGVDLVPIRPIRGAYSLQEDITTPKCKTALRKLMKENGFNMVDVVLHDGSPNVGGAWAKEATTQSALVVDALKLAVEFLAPKGTFVSKVFRSQDYNALLYCFNQLFEKVEVTKPASSRSTSAEIYIIGLRYKAPGKIDPRLLDVKYLFKEVVEPPKVLDVLRGSKQKRNREGYEEGISIVQKTCLASDFVWADKPLDLLGSVTSITFDKPACANIREHPLTTEEIKILCEDLRVLGKPDFKNLLKWRSRVREVLKSQESDKSLKSETNETAQDDGDDHERLLNEMGELHSILEKKKKKAQKLLAKRRAKAKARARTGMQVDVMEDGYVDQELFSLSSIKAKNDLKAIDSPLESDNADLSTCEDEDDDVDDEDSQASDMDSDEERRRYDEQIESILDEAYEHYVVAKEGSTKQRKRAKMAADSEGDLWKEEDETRYEASDEDDNADQDKDIELNPLVVSLTDSEKLSKEQLTKQWFSQDVFAGFEDSPKKYDSDSDHSGGQKVSSSKQLFSKSNKILEKKKTSVEPQSNVSEDKKVSADTDGNFEIVPAPSRSSSDSSSSEDESEYDTDTKAEILAFAKKMLRKKQREDIIDAAYNRYTFDDEHLPEWFEEDEKKHNQPQKPITKEEVEAMKAQFKEIDARPAKKVAQAKARKKRVAMKRFEAAKSKANAIANQTDISNFSKSKMIEKLYKKAIPKKPQKEYVVAKKGVPVKGGKGKVIVDRRMKKDKRAKGSGRDGKNSKKGKGKNRGTKAGKHKTSATADHVAGKHRKKV